ncbi:MFS transporter [Pandoraea thiooxydans]|uniref:MFS transporter n=1 Tax=Pandoraea thiooxydans TaxID=445709 RepID=A0A0G3EK95_9BURK|nr:MFS transporter [Pandoraea thiooxydans]AKJ67428.1 MFS transporter [Pandoraea thiooxydans]APR94457.1 MFS transporter [Pandoraea thiooxydans]
MTTVVVVRKHNEIAIAADSLVTFGETRLSQAYEANRKIFQIGDSYIGLAGTTAHFPVMRALLTGLGEECKLHSRDDVFRTFCKAHQKLKEEYFLNTKEEEDDPYESSQITCLIANPSGIYGVYSYREVFAFDRFWGIGSGRSFALGAMYAAYDSAPNASAIAELGVKAGAEFDKSSGGPFQIHAFPIPTPNATGDS